jgi:hypothetical protein
VVGFLGRDHRLYAVRTDGRGAPQRVNESTPHGGYFEFGRDRIVYLGGISIYDYDSSFEVFSRAYPTLLHVKGPR